MKNDRQVAISGGFGRPRVNKAARKEGISWKIRIMLALVGILIISVPYIFTSLVHQ